MMNPQDLVVASDHQMSSELEGEVVILDLKSGAYFGLDAVGMRVWELIQEPKPVSEIQDILMHEYDVDADRCLRDLTQLLEDLKAQGLVEVKS